jgi:hypothetical protein
MEPPLNRYMHLFLSEFECKLFLICSRNLTKHGATQNRGDAAGRHFQFTVQFFPSKALLCDGSVWNIERNTIMRCEVEFREIDPQEPHNMEERAMRNMVEKLGESVIWGPRQEASLLRFENWKGEYVRIESGEEMVDEIDRQDGWTTKEATFRAKLVDLKSYSKVGYVASKLPSQMSDDAWASRSQVMPIRTEVTVLAEGADAEADGICVDWNSVELHEGTDLAIAPMADTEMAKMFGIPVDDRDKEKEMDEAAEDDGKSHIYEDVDGELMNAAACDVDDAHDDELVTVYDKENPVIAVGKLFPNMDEFRMSFKTCAVKKEFDAKTMWTDRKKFYARCDGV